MRYTGWNKTIWLTWTSASTAGERVYRIPSAWLQAAQTAAIDIMSAQSTGNTALRYYTEWDAWANLVEETAEQKAVRRRAEAVREQRTRDLQAARKAASDRAERLLEACLSTTQRDQLSSVGWFSVRAPSGRVYQIRRGRARNVVEMTTRRTYCCHPIDGVPDADTMLAQKLMIETQEEEFLRLANVS